MNHNISTFYNLISQTINNNMIYVAYEPKFNAYSQYALPDVLFIASKDVTYKMLNRLSIIEHCFVKNTNWFHPESSFFNAIEYFGFIINELPFKAFPHPV